MPIPSMVREWKYRWDLVMNDKEFRRTADYTCHYTKGFTSKIDKMSGTIYIKDPKIQSQGHFIAYKKKLGKVTVFDPAPPQGRFGAWMDAKVIAHIRKVTGLPVVVKKYHTQHHTEDSFCATWTLAWLDPHLKKLTKNVKTNQENIRTVFQVCRHLANAPDFPERARKALRKHKYSDIQIRNFLGRTYEWLNAPLQKNTNPFWKIFED
jgi:hypothetical protein